MNTSKAQTHLGLIFAAVVLWLALFVAFGLPGVTLDWGRDLFVFFGQINALEHGQVPYRDFRTSMGALPFYLPWFGFRLVGGFGGALEMGGLLATALLLPCIVVALGNRFGLGKALLLMLCLAAVAAAPVDQGLSLPSHVGFYNRWSCTALAALFLFAVAPRRAGNAYVDGAAIAGLLLFLFFVKASYFAVGLVFVMGFGAVLGMFRRAALIGGGGLLAVVFVVQLATGVIDDYLRELAHSLDVSGVSWYARDQFLQSRLPGSLSYYALLGAACLLAFLGKAKLCWREWTLVLYATVGCVAIQGHDASFHGPFPLVAMLALLGERAKRGEKTAGGWRRWQQAMPILLTLFMLPYLANAAVAALDYRDHGAASPADLPRMEGVYLADLSVGGVPRRYLWHCVFYVADELRPGLRLLDRNGVTDGVLALDYYNWFPALLNVPPLVGRLAVLMPGRTFDGNTAPAPEEVFRHANYVMVPTASTKERRPLLALYGHHLDVSYRVLDSDEHWQLWERKR